MAGRTRIPQKLLAQIILVFQCLQNYYPIAPSSTVIEMQVRSLLILRFCFFTLIGKHQVCMSLHRVCLSHPLSWFSFLGNSDTSPRMFIRGDLCESICCWFPLGRNPTWFLFLSFFFTSYPLYPPHPNTANTSRVCLSYLLNSYIKRSKV